jgi:hypothetical protein
VPATLPFAIHVYLDLPSSSPEAALRTYQATSVSSSPLDPHLNTTVPLAPTPEPPPSSRIANLGSASAHQLDTQLLVCDGTVNGHPATVLIDSGAQRDFVSNRFIARHALSTTPLDQPLRIRLANGQLQATRQHLPDATVSFGPHTTTRPLTVTSIDAFDIILGKPWLTDVNPSIDWTTNTILTPFRFTVTSSTLPQPTIHVITAKRALKALRNRDNAGFYATLKDISPSSSDPPPPPPDPFKPSTTLSPDNEAKLHALLAAHRSTFDPPTGINPNLPPHRITLLPGTQPPVRRPYRMSPAELQEVQRQLEEQLAKGWIRPSTSEYGAPILFVRKKDGQLRMVVDYRALNSISRKDAAAMVRPDELFDLLQGARYLTSWDMSSAYNQCPIHPDDIHKTAFITPLGHFEFTVLPFGLTNAPTAFQRLMTQIFQPYLNKFVVTFLDDVVTYSRTEEDHLRHIGLVLAKLDEFGLKMKLSKCSFAQASIPYLGFIVSGTSLRMDPAKVAAVADWPLPSDQQGIRSFLGFTGFYRRFIRDYATIAAPLTDLTKTTVPFPATLPPAAVDAFNTIKTAVISAPVLTLPDTGPTATFELYTDASGTGVGAVLLQDQGNGPQPVAFESRKYTPAESNYAVHEQELLAIVYAVKKFRHYLEGCSHFTVYTDHHSLKYFFTQRDLSRRQARWSLALAPFQPNMTIVYRPGHKNQADGLSRLQSLTTSPVAYSLLCQLCDLLPAEITVNDDLMPSIASAYASDPLYSTTNPSRPKFLQQRDGFWYFQDRLCVPNSPTLRRRLLHEFHDTPSAGHPGHLRTLAAISQRFWWPHLSRSVKAYVSTCPTCQRSKPTNQPTPGLLRPHAVPSRPWSHVSVDLITKLPRSTCYDGQTYDAIATFVCMLTKQAHFVRINESITAPQLANVFIDHVYSKHGLPSLLVSDRDPRFNSLFWRTLFTALGTRLNLSTAYHPQTDGQTERTHRTIEQILRAYVHPCHDDWATWLPLAEFAYNNQYHRSTHTSPFYANYGYHPSSPTSFVLPPGASADAADYLSNLRDIQQIVAQELELEKAIMTTAVNKHRRDLRFKPGDQVRLSTEYLSLANHPSSKFRPRYLGPFTVLDTVPSNCPDAVSYRLDLPPSLSRLHPVFHVSRLLPWRSSPDDEFPSRHSPAQPIPPATDYLTGDNAFECDRILDVAVRTDPESRARPKAPNLFFKVKWAPPYHDPVHDSWEPYRNLKRLDAMKAFLRSPAYTAFLSTPAFQQFAAKHKAKVPKIVTFQD